MMTGPEREAYEQKAPFKLMALLICIQLVALYNWDYGVRFPLAFWNHTKTCLHGAGKQNPRPQTSNPSGISTRLSSKIIIIL